MPPLSAQEILEHLVALMMDPFGNYLIQKLLDRCSEEQRLQVGVQGASALAGRQRQRASAVRTPLQDSLPRVRS